MPVFYENVGKLYDAMWRVLRHHTENDREDQLMKHTRCFGRTAFQMVLDQHATQFIELIGGERFAVGDELHLIEQSGGERSEYRTGREQRIRVTETLRLTKALPVGAVLLTFELVEAGA